MGKEYTISNIQRRDEWESPKFGRFQDYAVTVEGDSLGWIKLTQKVETTPPRTGDKLFGSIVQAETKNGVTYRKFKKENPNYQGGGTGGGAPSEDTQQLRNDVAYVIEMLEELTLRRPSPENPQPRGNNSSSSQVEEYDDPFKDMGI